MKGKYTIEEGGNLLRIIKGTRGMIYFIRDNQIDLKNSLPYEASERGRCIGFAVKDINYAEFDMRAEEYARDKRLNIVKR